jgi:hypothetical protein
MRKKRKTTLDKNHQMSQEGAKDAKAISWRHRPGWPAPRLRLGLWSRIPALASRASGGTRAATSGRPRRERCAGCPKQRARGPEAPGSRTRPDAPPGQPEPDRRIRGSRCGRHTRCRPYVMLHQKDQIADIHTRAGLNRLILPAMRLTAGRGGIFEGRGEVGADAGEEAGAKLPHRRTRHEDRLPLGRLTLANPTLGLPETRCVEPGEGARVPGTLEGLSAWNFEGGLPTFPTGGSGTLQESKLSAAEQRGGGRRLDAVFRRPPLQRTRPRNLAPVWAAPPA